MKLFETGGLGVLLAAIIVACLPSELSADGSWTYQTSGAVCVGYTATERADLVLGSHGELLNNSGNNNGVYVYCAGPVQYRFNSFDEIQDYDPGQFYGIISVRDNNSTTDVSCFFDVHNMDAGLLHWDQDWTSGSSSSWQDIGVAIDWTTQDPVTIGYECFIPKWSGGANLKNGIASFSVRLCPDSGGC